MKSITICGIEYKEKEVDTMWWDYAKTTPINQFNDEGMIYMCSGVWLHPFEGLTEYEW
jgi:hypothetical protein